MSGVERGYVWTGRREEAAVMVARDELADEEIARRVGISRMTLELWKRRPEFRARVEEITIAMREAIRGKGIAELENRVAALNDRWMRMQRVIQARAEQFADVPGGDTGLLTCQMRPARTKLRAAGARAQAAGQLGLWEGDLAGDCLEESGVIEVAEYVVDLGLLRELREHEKQAAQDLGQWKAERESESTVVIREYVGVDPSKV